MLSLYRGGLSEVGRLARRLIFAPDLKDLVELAPLFLFSIFVFSLRLFIDAADLHPDGLWRRFEV